MKRLVMTAVPASGHVNPSAPVVRELIGRGTRVTYYATEQFRPLIESLGAEFRAYPEGTLSAEVLSEATSRAGAIGAVQRLLESTPTLLRGLRSSLREEMPDAVMFDSNALWGRMLAAELDRPGISLMTTILVGSSTARALRPRELLLVSKQSALSLPGVLGARSRLRQGTGRRLLPPSPLFPAQGDLSIFPVPEWMQPADRRRDPSCHYVGPAADLESRAEEADPELEAFLDTEEAVVLLSLGTLHAVGESFLRSCLEAFGRFPARVLISGGPGADPAALGPLPSHILVRRHVPQLAVLRRADVFVTHGGMNSVLESLHFGVPMVVLPQQLEQLLIGQAVAERGAGRVLRQHLRGADVPPATLRATVDSLLEDRTARASARALATTLHEGGGAGAAADRIERLLDASTAGDHAPR